MNTLASDTCHADQNNTNCRSSVTSPRYRNQLIATLTVNLVTIAYGLACGWPTVSLAVLGSTEDPPLPDGPLDFHQLSWVVSCLSLGSIFGNVLFSWMSDRFGRRFALLPIAVLAAFGSAVLLMAETHLHLCVARLSQGFAGGGVYAVVPVFVAEIADKEVRGSLGTQTIFYCNIGVLLSFASGEFLSYAMRPIVLIVFPIIFLFLFVLLPETPAFLMRYGRIDEAERSLRFYRNSDSSDVPNENDEANHHMMSIEMTDLQKPIAAEENFEINNTALRSIDWSAFNSLQGRRAIQIGLALFIGNQLCGCFVLLNYTSEIFAHTGTRTNVVAAAILCGCVQLLGSYASTLLVDRMGRRPLLVVSAVGSSVGLLLLGCYIHSHQLGYVLPTSLSWLPTASLAVVILFGNVGMISLPLLIMTEILPESVRSMGASMCLTVLYVLGFGLQKSFPLLVSCCGMAGVMYMFAGASIMSVAFAVRLMPETKARSFDEIRRLMERR